MVHLNWFNVILVLMVMNDDCDVRGCLSIVNRQMEQIAFSVNRCRLRNDRIKITTHNLLPVLSPDFSLYKHISLSIYMYSQILLHDVRTGPVLSSSSAVVCVVTVYVYAYVDVLTLLI